jgi:hypothetical protein
LAISQVGEYLDDTDKLAEIVPSLVEHAHHSSPKIRFAALHAIGLLAADLQAEFTTAYHE